LGTSLNELIAASQQKLASLQARIQDVDSRVSDTSELLADSVKQANRQNDDLGTTLNELIAALQQQVNSLQTRIQDLDSRASDTSEVLAVSVKQANKQSDALGVALKPIVIDKFHEASREDPDTMAEALFPILGPAVRKMIVNIITPDKNAKKFGYQVEQLFVIDNATGLPVCHVASESAQTQDADMVSGMLSAIQSFVQDAFETKEFDGLNTLQMGDLSVWIEWGPQAALAAVVRGAPPQRLRDAMQIKVEKIHKEYTDVLKDYDGDASKLDSLSPELTTFLNTHDGSFVNQVKNLTSRAKRNWAIAGIALFGLIIWMLLGRAEQASWDDFVTTLGSEPGLVVTDQRVEEGVYKVFGLRDEYASKPVDIHKNSDNDRKVEFHFEPYQSVHPEFIKQRTIALLKPPADVKISIVRSTLYVSGKASQEWIEKAKPLSHTIHGTSTTIFNVRTIEPNP